MDMIAYYISRIFFSLTSRSGCFFRRDSCRTCSLRSGGLRAIRNSFRRLRSTIRLVWQKKEVTKIQIIRSTRTAWRQSNLPCYLSNSSLILLAMTFSSLCSSKVERINCKTFALTKRTFSRNLTIDLQPWRIRALLVSSPGTQC